jgi:hypothetical protein
MKPYTPMPETLADTASFLTAHEQALMWDAAILMADSRGLLMRLTAMFGRRIESLRSRISKTGDRFGGEAWAQLTQRAQDAVEQLQPRHLRSYRHPAHRPAETPAPQCGP